MEYERLSCACFTGHRSMTEADVRGLADKLNETVEELVKGGVVNFYVGGAVGFDMAASVSVLNLKSRYPSITLNVAVPCPDHQKNWRAAERELFARVCKRADSVVTVSASYTPFCMHVRNRYMVDRSSVCIAFLTENSGGTASTVGYARKKGLKVINLAEVEGYQLTFGI